MSPTSRITHGREARRTTLAGQTLVESLYPPKAELEPHAHAHPYLVFVLDGTFEERSRRGRHACGPGMVMIRPAGTRHSDHFGDRGTRAMIVGIHAPEAVGDAFGDVFHFRSGPPVSVAARLHAEMRRADTAAEYVVDGLMRELAGHVLRYERIEDSEVRPPDWLARARDRLREEYLDPPLIRDLAEEAGVHPDHLSRSFRRHFGTLPGEFLRSIRLEWAAHRLLDDASTIAAIAARAGYADQSHFTRAFKARYGVPPGRWRRTRAG